MPNVYDRGDLVRSTATFMASGGAYGDPSQVWCLIVGALAGVATHRYGLTPSAIVRSGLGAYYIDINIDQIGGWAYRWEGTGNNLQAAEETTFAVRQTFKL